MTTAVRKFIAPLPPAVRKVKVNHNLDRWQPVFTILTADHSVFFTGYEYAFLSPNSIEFNFWDKLPTGLRIIVTG